MDHENITCYLFLGSACSFWAEDQDPVSCHGHAREPAMLLALPLTLAAQKTSLIQGLFPTSCSPSAARDLPEGHLLFLWTADRTLDVAWSFLLGGFWSGSFILSLWPVSWSMVTLFLGERGGVCCECVSSITSLAALTPLFTCETVLISSVCYHRISVSQHPWQDWMCHTKKLRTVCK